MRDIDIGEEQKIDRFLSNGCDCRGDAKCCSRFSKDEYRSNRCQWQELDHDSCDLAVMGHLMSCQDLSQELERSQSHRRGKARERYRGMYFHRGIKVTNLKKCKLNCKLYCTIH